MKVIEAECKHCGAPMGVRHASDFHFDNCLGETGSRLRNHKPNEHDFDESKIVAVKYVFVKCSECRNIF